MASGAGAPAERSPHVGHSAYQLVGMTVQLRSQVGAPGPPFGKGLIWGGRCRTDLLRKVPQAHHLPFQSQSLDTGQPQGLATNPSARCLPTDTWDAASLATQPLPDSKDPFSLSNEVSAYGSWAAREKPVDWSELVVSLAALPSVDRASQEQGTRS